VHYKYFRGGSRAHWVEEHQYKEQWADCWIYQIKLGGKFDRQGRPLNLPNIKNQGDARLISEAQQMFISSGLSVDRGGTAGLPKRETPVEIQKRLSAAEAVIRDYLANFDKWHCDALEGWVANYDWTLDELQHYYDQSLEVTRNLLTKFPK
jgi:hypothetical protein